MLHPPEEGTPQGGICSPVLAHLTLDGLERVLREHYPTNTKRAKRAKVNLSRYAADFIITGSSKELLESEVKPLVEDFLAQRGRELSQEKTQITQINEGFDFLGWNVRKYDDKLLITPFTPSKKAIQTFLNDLREEITSHRQLAAGKLIALLNPKIRGWVTYHCRVVSKKTFQSVDHARHQCLWHWAKRRHPNKPSAWVKKRYFCTIGRRDWVFFGKVATKDGDTRTILVELAGKTPIRRHTKIQGPANPYDPAWELYFEQRLGARMAQTSKGQWRRLTLWMQQRGICPVCSQMITELRGCDMHHILWRVEGGSDGMANRILVHPNRHRQLHSQGLTVAKPRPATGVRKA